MCVALDISIMMTWHRPLLPPNKIMLGSLPWHSNTEWGLRSLPHLREQLTSRADDSHATAVYHPRRQLYFHKACRYISNPGKVYRFVSNWTTCSTGCAPPRQFVWVSALRLYSPGDPFNAFANIPSDKSGRTNGQCLQLGLLRSLIWFATLAFVSERQYVPSYPPSRLVFFLVSTDLTPTLKIPVTPISL